MKTMKRTNLYKILCVLLFAVAVFPLHAQNVKVAATWDTNGTALGKQAQITLGDQLDLVISVTSGSMPVVTFPTSEELTRNNLVVVSQRIDTVQGNPVTIRQYTTITSFEEGKHSTGPLTVQIASGSSMVSMVCPDSLLLTVLDVPNVDTTAKAQIKDIAGLMREPYTFWEIFRWILLALLVAGLVYGAIYVSRKLKKHEPIIVLPQAPPEPPHRHALQQLEALRVKGLWQSGRTKEYHTELTDIVREYLRGQYGIDSAEMTSDQTLDAFRQCAYWDQECADLLCHILRIADMVKFAKADPQAYEHDLALKNAIEFVEKSKKPNPERKTNASV